MLLSRAVDTPGIRVHFKHKVAAIDFERRVMTLADLEDGRDIQAAFDLCIGADGSYSVVRRQLQRVVR
jgi:kynurenine 3-monooxygenase